MELTIKQVIDEGYCIGCGVCPFVDSSIRIERDEKGKNQAVLSNESSSLATAICPFASSERNEDFLGNLYYGKQSNVSHSEELGYYLSTHIGYVNSNEFRKKGSSGGVGNWILAKLLEENMIDGVIHVKNSRNKKSMYSYQISESVEELLEGSKSKYYPVELSEVLEEVRKTEKKYALVGIPCFIKSIRLLQQDFPELKEKIIFIVGLVCGHMKSDFFAKSQAWESGIDFKSLEYIDFRVKLPDKNASSYGIEAIGTINGEKKKVIVPKSNLSTTNWGYGFFKYQACDYCDDVLAELADITVGDAWISKYVQDTEGTNIIVIRNKKILDIFMKYSKELKLFESNANEIAESQAGGFRHRREGLKYRLWLKNQIEAIVPTKRIAPSDNIPEKRKKIYKARIELVDESFNAFQYAMQNDDFSYFNEYMNPFLKKYDKISIPIKKRMKIKMKKIIPKNLKEILKVFKSY